MKTFFTYIIAYLLRCALWFRYRLKVKGLDKLTPEVLNKPGGVFFLPNHPAVFVDPISVSLATWPKFPIRPLIVEYMYYTPGVHFVAKLLDSLPIPNFAYSSNSLKRRKSEEAINTIISSLRLKQNFLLYPAGKLKLSAIESLGGASAAHQIIQECPEANIVLVRVKGLWGSSFSTYLQGKSPNMIPMLWQGVKFCLKNLLFFTPRREVIIEFEPAPADFPYKASRLEFNRYLEHWYNKPDGLTPQVGVLPGDSLVLVSYSMWGEKYLPLQKNTAGQIGETKFDNIQDEVKRKVLAKLAEITERDPSTIQPQMDLATDLAMDSLDMAELASYLQDHFEIRSIPVNYITDVKTVMAIASKQLVFEEEAEPEPNISKWTKPLPHERVQSFSGDTIVEAFLNTCANRGSAIACGDIRTGLLTYSQIKKRALLLAERIRTMPGAYIGILLPACVTANITILATMLAGKIPLMVNWTVGPRHLEAVVELSKVEVVLTSWAFIDKLENVEFNGIEDKMVLLEDIRREFSLADKLKALYRSKLSTTSLLKIFNCDKLKPSDIAVLLFTSGTESMPKGVPLSHGNILANIRSTLKHINIYRDDVLLGILPPFHAFGFTISSLFALLIGIRLASYSDPTNGTKLAENIEKWSATIVCGAPTFLKGMLKAAKPKQLNSLRLCVTGSEKAPAELFKMIAMHGKKEAIIEGYGITECSPVLTANLYGEPTRGVGKPLDGVELCIVHPETFVDLPTGTQGMILARGPSIFKGYLNPEVASPFVEHQGKTWYKTGDLGFLDKDGYLTIGGRLKRFVKIGGEMISLASIEDALAQGLIGDKAIHEMGPSLAITAQESEQEKTKIFLFTLSDTDVDSANQCLRQQGFSNLVRISKVIKLDDIPLLGTGKTNYRALSEMLK